MTEIKRVDTWVDGEGELRLFAREVTAGGAARDGRTVVLVHGAWAGGLASFDLDVPGGSLAGDLAAAGHRVNVMDARGYGSSDRPASMRRQPDGNPPAVRSHEVTRDIAAVVEWVCRRADDDKVALLGWATGGHWAGQYAAQYPERVSHLALYNTLYGGTTEHPSLGRGSDLEDPARPGRFNPAIPAWRLADASSLLAAWNASTPEDERDAWRDPAVTEAYARTAISRDPESATRTPATLAVPTGALEDSFYLACGRQLWDASFVRAHTLVIRSERDFWSRPGDVELLAAHLSHAASVRAVTIPDATHFVHLERPERGRDQFLAEVLALLA